MTTQAAQSAVEQTKWLVTAFGSTEVPPELQNQVVENQASLMEKQRYHRLLPEQKRDVPNPMVSPHPRLMRLVRKMETLASPALMQSVARIHMKEDQRLHLKVAVPGEEEEAAVAMNGPPEKELYYADQSR